MNLIDENNTSNAPVNIIMYNAYEPKSIVSRKMNSTFVLVGKVTATIFSATLLSSMGHGGEEDLLMHRNRS